MRSILAIIFSILILNVSAQKTITDNINTVKKLNIYGNGTKVNIGKIIVNTTLVTKLYFIKATQQKDTSNNWVTSIYLGNNNRLPLFNANLSFKFSAPIDLAGSGGVSQETKVEEGFLEPKNYIYKCSQIIREYDSPLVIVFFFKSKEKVTVDITGVDGILPSTD